MSEGAIVGDTGAAVADEGTAAVVADAGTPAVGGTWREGLGAEYKDHPALADFADVPALAESYVATKEMVGKKGIILPKEGDAADQARFRSEIGVPETAAEYSAFTPPEGLPWSAEGQTAMLGRMHKLGIPDGQAQDILTEYAEMQAEQIQQMQATAGTGHEQGVAALKEEWGADYDSKTALAGRAFKAAAGERFDELSHIVLPDGTHLGDHPAFVSTFAAVGAQYQEHGLAGEKVGGGGFMKTPEQAKAEINELWKNPAYTNADDPEHAMVVSKMDDLHKQAFPETQSEV